MLDGASQSLWAKVCETVTRLGDPRPSMQFGQMVMERAESDFLDLHGMTVNEAHRAVTDFINRPNAPRALTIVTGLSGVICREFPHWLEGNLRISSVTETNGGGAYTVRMRRPK